MAQEVDKLIIAIDVKDADKAKQALKGIEVGFKNVADKGKKELGRLRVSTEGLRRSLGSIRNNLLLVTFAVEGTRRAFTGFFKARAEMEKYEARLRAMSGSAEIATKQLNQFVDIASKTPFTISEIVQGGVQLEAFGANAEVLIPVMANLAALMNRTVPEAANAFGRAFAGGRGAADVFRETGILTIIDDFQSLDESLNKSGLTLTQFRIKMIEALSDPEGKVANGINELEGTLFQSFANMEDAIFMFKDRVGTELEPLFQNFAKTVTRFFNSIDINVIHDIGAAIKLVLAASIAFAIQVLLKFTYSLRVFVLDMGLFVTAVNSGTASVIRFNAALKRNIIGLVLTAIAAGVILFERLNNRIDLGTEKLEENKKTVEEYIEELKKQAKVEALEEANKKAAEYTIELQKQLDLLNATTEVQKVSIEQGRNLTQQERVLVNAIQRRKSELKEIAELEKSREKILEKLQSVEQENSAIRLGRFQAEKEFQKMNLSEEIKNANAINQIKEELTQKNIDLEALKLQKMIDLNDANLLTEEFRANAKREIEEKYARDVEAITEESQKKIQEIKDSYSEEELMRLAENAENIRQYNLMVQDMYMNAFSNIQQAFSTMVKNNMDQEIKALKKTDKYRNASTEERENMENDIKEKFANQQKLAFRAQQAIQIAEVFMSLQRAIFQINAAAAVAASAGDFTAKARAAKLIGMLKISSGVQTALIASQKPPAFARGGSFITDGPQQILVGDNPGGRERVDIRPLSSPNFDGPQGSEVTVNIMGNVIGTQEFVRDTLIPEIDRSIRRNLA